MKKIINLLIMSILSNFFLGCNTKKAKYFAEDVPIKNEHLKTQFSANLIYQSSPDTSIIIGVKKIEPAIFEIFGFDSQTSKQLWKLPFVGEVVGQTKTQLLVYEEKTNTVHFVNPSNGEITRKIKPAPAPLSSKTQMAYGMAFTDEMYLTTKALYTQVVENGKIDTTWQIGITAKTWQKNEMKWFLPPVNQIINIRYRPSIVNDKVLIINTQRKINEGHSYQIVSLQTGEELFRQSTNGTFIWLKEQFLIDKNKTILKRIDPFLNKDLWQIEGDFEKANITILGKQLSVISPFINHKNIKLIDIETGKIIKDFDLPQSENAVLQEVFETKNKQILLHFQRRNYAAIATNEFDYWVCYDSFNKKPLWRTDFHSESLSSILSFSNSEL